MKKTLALFLLLFTLFVSFAGCGKLLPAPDEDTSEDNDPHMEIETDRPNYNPELRDIMMFCIKRNIKDYSEKLIAVTRDGKEIVIIPDTNAITVNGIMYPLLINFDYYQNKLFLNLNSGIAYIKLDEGDGKYEINFLTSDCPVRQGSIVATADSIYVNDWRYSLVDGTYGYEDYNRQASGGAIKYDKAGNNLVIWDENNNLILVDCATGNEKTVDSNITFPNVYNSKIVYRKHIGLRSDNRFSYYEYDINSGATKELSGVINSNTGTIEKAEIFPYGDDGYLYYFDMPETQKYQIMLYENGENEIIAELDCPSILYVSLLSKDKIGMINHGDRDFVLGEMVNITMDLKTKSINNEELDYIYIYDVWAEGFSSDYH